MKNVRTAIVAALLATSLVAAGCGSDDDSSSTSTPTPTEATSTPTTESTPTTATTPGNVDDAVKAAIESCKSAVNAQPTISADVKTKLNTLCEKATDAAGAAEAAKEVCKAVVDGLPAGTPDAAKQQASAACEASVPK
jgi:PBP1b-binding outer membrane lipoprotein LpoB